MRLSRTNQLLGDLLSRAEIKEAVFPGSAIRLLPSEKELSRLAHLASQLCALRRKSCKSIVRPAKGKEPIKYGFNVAAMKASRNGGCSKSFSALCESGYKQGAFKSR